MADKSAKNQPRAIEPQWAAVIAADFDMTAEICRKHHDRTGAAAFTTCANRIRRAALLPGFDLRSESMNLRCPRCGSEDIAVTAERHTCVSCGAFGWPSIGNFVVTA